MPFQPKNSPTGWNGNSNGRPPVPRFKLSKELLAEAESKNRKIYFNFLDDLEGGDKSLYPTWFKYHVPPPPAGIDIVNHQSSEYSEYLKGLSAEDLRELKQILEQITVDFISSRRAHVQEEETDGNE
jgi:hypothetical protein